jgi:hypothetical protein
MASCGNSLLREDGGEQVENGNYCLAAYAAWNFRVMQPV